MSITLQGYPIKTARELAYFTDYIMQSTHSDIVKNLVRLCILNTLEPVSYSSKQGQYLAWDYRCPKIVAAVKDREEKGRKPFATRLDKGTIPELKETLLSELRNVMNDIVDIQGKGTQLKAHCDFTEGSVLFEIPKMQSDTIDGVITSPPYCNQYDYTRTYAMELAYLGKTDADFTKTEHYKKLIKPCKFAADMAKSIIREYLKWWMATLLNLESCLLNCSEYASLEHI
ncbi:MAG: hypothetical protein IJ081_06145 [Prevotella sp.]|nr:hypothetical protein [Prevotella sp.]